MRNYAAHLSHARALLVLGLPLIGSHIAQFVLHLTDTVMLGWYGIVPLAAGVLGGSSFFTDFILGSGFAKAVMPMVATAMGQGDEVQVRRDTRMGLWLSIGYGIAVLPVFWSEGGHVLRDLPALIDQTQQQFPGLQVQTWPVLSRWPGLLDWLAGQALAQLGASKL